MDTRDKQQIIDWANLLINNENPPRNRTVYLPFYVMGTEKFDSLGMYITLPELDRPSRFVVLKQIINNTLSFSDVKVGLNKNEAIGLINQKKSLYKMPMLSFIGYVEILLPLYNLQRPSNEEGVWAIKEGSRIELHDIIAFSLTDHHTKSLCRLADSPRAKFFIKKLEGLEGGKIVNTNEDTPPSLPYKNFKSGGPLNNKELIEEALSNYRDEYERAIELDPSKKSILDNIKELEEIYYQDIPLQQKILLLDQNKEDKEYGGRLAELIDGIKAYYEKLSRAKIQIEEFLTKEIAALRQRIELEKNSNNTLGGQLLGWINQSNDKSTMNEAVNTHESEKINKLQAVLDWSLTQVLNEKNDLSNVKMLIHSICALKRTMAPIKSTSQTHFEEFFQMDLKPALEANDLKQLNSKDDVDTLCQKITQLQNNNSSGCKIQ